MNIKSTKILFLCSTQLFCLLTKAQEERKQSHTDYLSERPNIIFILTDDQRWSALGYAGNKFATTPEMDKLAESGTYFRNAIATTPICSASRASIFSGVQERTHRYTFQSDVIRSEFMETAYPRVLKEAGYYTAFYGKFGVKFPNKNEMFDEIEDYDRNNKFKDYRGYYYKKLGKDTVHLTRYTGQKALDFIDQAPEDQPFCLSLSFSAPHAHDGAPQQYFWQEEPGKLYQDMDMPDPELADDNFFNTLPQIVREGFNRTRWYWRYDTPEKYQHSIKGYYRMLYGVDMELTKIRKKLAEKGLEDNTIIIVMGDNGFFMGERQISGKWLMYDNSIRIPLIVYDPRAEIHQDVDEMALNIDIPPTILHLADVNVPDTYQGKSLVSIISGSAKSMNRDTVLIEHLWEFDQIPPSEGIRTAEWKYFRYVNDKSIEELYNLKMDPQESLNLANNKEYETILKELRAKNDELAKRYADPFATAPTGLAVKFIKNQEKLKNIDSKPKFSWILPIKVKVQKGYQILIASSPELLNKNIGNIWNSGNVRSNQSTDVEIGSALLKDNTAYFWKVRYYDGDNRISEYSEMQKFTTGDFSN